MISYLNEDSNNVEGAKKIVDENDTDDDTFIETLDKIDDDKNPEAVELVKDAQFEQVSQNEPDIEDLDDEVIFKTIPVIETFEAGDILKELINDSDAKDDCFNEIASKNDIKT